MTENPTLGDFGGESAVDSDAKDDDPTVEAEAQADGESEEHAVDVDADSADAAPDAADAVETATVTYSWSPDGDECAACGETVEKRWRAGEGAADPDAMVCPDCKEW